MTISVVRALMFMVTAASAFVPVPEMVVAEAVLFDTLTSSGKRIPFIMFVITMAHLVVTRTVQVLIVGLTVDILAIWTAD